MYTFQRLLKLEPNSLSQNRLVKWGVSPLYKLSSRVSSIRRGTWIFPNTPPSRPTLLGLVRESVGDPWIRQALIPFCNLGPNTTPQNWLVRWGVPHFYILSSRVLSLLKSHITVAWTIICGCFQSYIQRRAEDTDNWQRWWGYTWDVQRRLWRSASAIYNWKHNIFKKPIFFIFEFSYHAIIYLIVQLIRPMRRTGRQSS